MKTNYNNWVPMRILNILKLIIFTLIALSFVFVFLSNKGVLFLIFSVVFILAAIIMIYFYQILVFMRKTFDYSNKNSLAWKIIYNTIENLKPENSFSRILDVGCGSGALSIALAKKYPEAEIIGIDRWGFNYSGEFNKKICENNAISEGVNNVKFFSGDANKLDFEDESFDGLISNYVYHIIPGDRNLLLRESFRVLKKGGVFAIHDIFSNSKYPKLDELISELKNEGYIVDLIETDDGNPIDSDIARKTMLKGSKILCGKK